MTTTNFKKMTVISGPCVIEDEGFILEVAQELKKQVSGLPIEFYFKSSFDKANRTSIDGFRGPGLENGLKILEKVKSRTGLPVLTDFHTPEQAQKVSESVDFLQVPAFLCRQTDMIVAAAENCLKNKKRLNIKKGQFLAPWDTKNIVEKVRAVEKKLNITSFRDDWFCLTERGTSFGYNTLVVDMTSFQTMKRFGVPTIYDATHSIQMPGAGKDGKSTGGKREHLETLARSAIAAGCDGLFMEAHPFPDKAKSDGPNAFYLEHVGTFLKQLLKLKETVDSFPKLLPEAKQYEEEIKL